MLSFIFVCLILKFSKGARVAKIVSVPECLSEVLWPRGGAVFVDRFQTLTLPAHISHVHNNLIMQIVHSSRVGAAFMHVTWATCAFDARTR